MLLFLVLRVIDVLNNRKSKKHLETIVTFLTHQGDTAMKSFFKNASDQVNAELAAKPVTGNEQMVTKTFADIQRQAAQQSFGLVQLMLMAAVAKAANAQHAEMDEIIQSVRHQLATEGATFDGQTREYLEHALGSDPAELVKVLQSVANTQLSAPEPQAVPPVPQEPVPTDGPKSYRPPPDSGNVVSFSKNTENDPREPEIKAMLSQVSWLKVPLPNEPYSLKELPVSTFDRLWGAFNVKADKNKNEMQIYEYLFEIHNARSMGVGHKVG